MMTEREPKANTLARIVAEVFFALGLLLVWVGILHYHASNWPSYDEPQDDDDSSSSEKPPPSTVFQSISYTQTPLDEFSLVASIAGMCVICICGLVSLVLLPTKLKERGIGVFSGLIISVTAWYLFRIEAKAALESVRMLPYIAEDSPERHLWAPFVSNLVLTLIAIILTHGNLLHLQMFEIHDEVQYIVIKTALMGGILFGQLYFTVMIYGNFFLGFLLLVLSLILAVGSLIMGRIMEYHNQNKLPVLASETKSLLIR